MSNLTKSSLRLASFQPRPIRHGRAFLSTKPTGQGTGLGLSLAYDIVKAHNGELKVVTPHTGQAGITGEGSEFIIHLPIVTN